MSYIYTKKFALQLTFVKVNGKDLSNYLASGSKVGWYDVSKNSGREVSNANGDMILIVVNDKYRLDLVTRPMTDDEVVDFFSEIKKQPTMTVEFLNPFTKQMQTISCYRGDRAVEWQQPYGGSILFASVQQALIEL